MSYGFSKFIKTESPVFLVLQLVMYGFYAALHVRSIGSASAIKQLRQSPDPSKKANQSG